MGFWESSSFWLDAVIAACALGAACAVVGQYTILRRVVFLPAALSQVSGLGVVLAFLLPVWVPSLADSNALSPQVMAWVVTLLASLLFGWMPEPRRLGRDGWIGIAYVLASAMILVIGDRIPQDAHDIKDVLFGNAVMVERSQMWVALGVSAVVLLVHGLLRRSFMMASFDRETAQAHGVPVRWVDAVLFLSLGMTIATATKSIGALPVFGFTVVPSAAGLVAARGLGASFALAALAGAASAFFGYWVSFSWSVPTGACMAAMTVVTLVAAAMVRRLRRV